MKTIIDPTTGIHADPVAQNGDVDGGPGGAPALLFSQTTAPLAAGEVQNLPIKTLQLGFRAAFLVDEIRMVAFSEPFNVLTDFINYGLSGCVGVKFETGKHAFSGGNRTPDPTIGAFADGFVPMGVYAPRWDTNASEMSAVSAGDSGGVDLQRSYARVRWPLPKPLYLAPGDTIRCSVQRFPWVSGGPQINFQVAYVGRVVAPGAPVPLMRQVPWVAYMQKYGANTVAMSNQEFRNPFTRPLMVQRFTHRLYVASAAGAGQFVERWQAQQVPGGTFYEAVQIEDSLGYQVTNDYVPVGHVFDLFRHAWTFARPIGPKEQFNVKLRRETASGTYITNIGMIGYRDEVL